MKDVCALHRSDTYKINMTTIVATNVTMLCNLRHHYCYLVVTIIVMFIINIIIAIVIVNRILIFITTTNSNTEAFNGNHVDDMLQAILCPKRVCFLLPPYIFNTSAALQKTDFSSYDMSSGILFVFGLVLITTASTSQFSFYYPHAQKKVAQTGFANLR